VVGSYATLLALGSTVRELRDLGIGIIASPAAADVLIAIDATGVLLGDGGVAVEVAKHANILMDSGEGEAGTTTVSLFQRNLLSLRAERCFRFDVRQNAVAFLTLEGSPA
jgi:hypothetical protein